MNRIHQLDNDLANKIAAGEVIERPANVIKELVENSIDAKATHIDVMVTEGGLESMRVSDDGIGMSHDDALLCFAKHATSKIYRTADLFNITTLGFRGEAIPSIAAISRFTLVTNDGEEGTKIIYDYGQKTTEEEISAPKGTRITVEKIFQNVPARLKYMKSVNSEFGAIYTYIERLSLARPDIAFSLTHNDREIYRTNGQGRLLEVISAIYGVPTARKMLAIDSGSEEFKISGYISMTEVSRASKAHIITMVNHRYVRHKKTVDTINDVYRAYLPPKRYPIAIINIDVDPYLVDVNVHPAKLEVRFSKEDTLNELLTKTLREAITQSILPSPRLEQAFHVSYDEIKEEKPAQKVSYDQISFDLKVADATPPRHKEKLSLDDLPVSELKEKIYYKGQILGKYLIGENERGVYLINIAAAAYRVSFERYQKAYQKLSLTLQPLTVPVTLDLTASECMLLSEHEQELAMIGITLEEIGPNSYCVRSLPAWMSQVDAPHFIEAMANYILENKNADIVTLENKAIYTLTNESLHQPHHLTDDEAAVLIDQLMRCDTPYVDPDGMPTLIRYHAQEIESLFKKGRS